jgi:D-tyrosyl-tRNA(Tyr) deacylase
MIGLIQRVSRASVSIDGAVAGDIQQGLLALIGVEKADTQKIADRLLERMLSYRVFSDDDGKMNLSLNDIGAGLLLVPQFTLVADTRKGNRPGFSNGAPPAQGKALFEYLQDTARQQHHNVASGVFGADMQVELVNDGPVTFWLQV